MNSEENNQTTQQGEGRAEGEHEATGFVISESQERNLILASKTWTWDAIQVGSCRIEAGATFTLFSDGSTYWSCDISSGDTGDEWDGYFRIKNSTGVVLFDTGKYHFNISEKDVKKRWAEHRGANSGYAAHYNEAQAMSFPCSC